MRWPVRRCGRRGRVPLWLLISRLPSSVNCCRRSFRSAMLSNGVRRSPESATAKRVIYALSRLREGASARTVGGRQVTAI